MDNGVWDRFVAVLWADIDEKEEFWSRKPHLAHYTSITAMQKSWSPTRFGFLTLST